MVWRKHVEVLKVGAIPNDIKDDTLADVVIYKNNSAVAIL